MVLRVHGSGPSAEESDRPGRSVVSLRIEGGTLGKSCMSSRDGVVGVVY